MNLGSDRAGSVFPLGACNPAGYDVVRIHFVKRDVNLLGDLRMTHTMLMLSRYKRSATHPRTCPALICASVMPAEHPQEQDHSINPSCLHTAGSCNGDSTGHHGLLSLPSCGRLYADDAQAAVSAMTIQHGQSSFQDDSCNWPSLVNPRPGSCAPMDAGCSFCDSCWVFRGCLSKPVQNIECIRDKASAAPQPAIAVQARGISASETRQAAPCLLAQLWDVHNGVIF